LKRYAIFYDPAAVGDLASLHRWIETNASRRIADDYVARIRRFCRQLRHFPHRGARRDDIRPGVRVIGFERRVAVAFEVQDDQVVIIRVLYAGRQFDSR
jgi:toxin ParE1/3/4